MYRILKIVLAALIYTSCSPRLATPDIEPPKEYIFGRAFSSDTTSLKAEWWQMFGDTTLNALVEMAFDANRNLATAASRIEQARHNLKVARAAFLPSVAVAGTAGMSYTSSDTTFEQNYALGASVGWEVPLFSTLRYVSEAARASIMYEEWHYRGVRLSLAAEVATSYFTLLGYRQDLDIAKRSALLRGEMVSLIDSMVSYGFASGVHAEQAHSLLYTAEADIPLYERAIDQTTLALNTLLGQSPKLFDSLTTCRLTGNNLFYEIPIATPSDILHRRPDIMQAYYTMRQAAAKVGSARSARFPSISLPQSANNNQISELFTGGAWAAAVMLALSQPVYNFGRLKHAELAAREAYHQSLLAYEECYLGALAEVEKALVAISTFRQQIARYDELVRANRDIAQMNRQLYASGMSDYLNVIDAERELYASQMQFENLATQQYINYINLCKALGGGWQPLDEHSTIKRAKKR